MISDYIFFEKELENCKLFLNLKTLYKIPWNFNFYMEAEITIENIVFVWFSFLSKFYL